MFIGMVARSYHTEAKIYTLGSRRWRKIVNVPYVCVEVEAGVFVNGSLHRFMREFINMEVM